MKLDRYRRLLADRQTRRFLTGLGVSALGDGLSIVTIAWLAVVIAPAGDSGIFVGFAVAAYTLPGRHRCRAAAPVRRDAPGARDGARTCGPARRLPRAHRRPLDRRRAAALPVRGAPGRILVAVRVGHRRRVHDVVCPCRPGRPAGGQLAGQCPGLVRDDRRSGRRRHPAVRDQSGRDPRAGCRLVRGPRPGGLADPDRCRSDGCPGRHGRGRVGIPAAAPSRPAEPHRRDLGVLLPVRPGRGRPAGLRRARSGGAGRAARSVLDVLRRGRPHRNRDHRRPPCPQHAPR